MGRDSLHSRAYARRNKTKKKVFIFLAVIALGFLVYGTTWITNSSPLVIKDINISGLDITPMGEVENIVSQNLQASTLLWSKNNALLAPRSDVEAQLKNSFDWIKAVDARVEGISQFAVSITEYEPAYSVCGLEDKDLCYFADETGFIFAKSLRLENSPYILFRLDIASTSSEDLIDSRVVPKEEFEKILVFVAGLRDNGLDITEIRVKKGGETELILDAGVRVIIDRKENTEEMLGNFLLLLARETTNHDNNRMLFLNSTEYIDVRYNNKVFYKAKE